MVLSDEYLSQQKEDEGRNMLLQMRGKKGVKSDIALLEGMSYCTGSDITQDSIPKMNFHKPMQENI